MSDINIVLENRDDIHVAVEEKDINVEVPAGKDGRSLRPRGEWSASVAYAYLDLVSYQGSSYVATKAVPAGTLPTDTSYWMLSAEKGEPGGAVWGNIAGDLSDQTDLQNALDNKAPVILSSASGSIASFTDGSPAPVTALSVDIEPVQDLHGYDNPWPAGGGKNKFDPSAMPTPTSSIQYHAFYVGDGTWTASTDAPYVNGNAMIFFLAGNVSSGASTVTNGVSPTVGRTQTAVDGYVTIAWRSLNDTVPSQYHIQIESGSAITSWTPYSNICPISGWDEATVTRTGKNLWHDDVLSNPSVTISDGVISATGNTFFANFRNGISGFPDLTNQISISAKAYTDGSQGNTGNGLFFRIYYKDGTYETLQWLNSDSSYTYRSLTSNSAKAINYVALSCSSSGNNVWNIKEVQMEFSSSPSSYEAPQIQTVTIDLDGTRYGGTLNVLTGEMTVTWVKVVFDGANDGNRVSYKYPNRYVYNLSAPSVGNTLIPTPNGNTVIGCLSDYFQNITDNQAYDGSRNGFSTSTSGGFAKLSAPSIKAESQADMNAWLAAHPVTVVYPLATPLTVTLSPAQISTLLGENHIFADTGDISVTYLADTKLYIEGQIAQTAKVTRQMIADSATADGKAPKSLATGDLIIVGDELRKATANIGNGSAITASNSTTATLADVIKALQ